MGVINVITLQGYYYLYALYFDYPINNAFFTQEENAERVWEVVRVVQRMKALVQPHRKSWPVRLFTERDAVSRFSPDAVNQMLVDLRELVEQLGPPPGWSRGPLPPPTRVAGRHPRRRSARMAPAAGEEPSPRRPPIPFPPAPFPYRLTG
jgi:hypothetical protein